MSDADESASVRGWGFICPRCGYDTRSLARDHCPECGTTRDEAVALRKRRDAAGPLAHRIAAACLTSVHGGLLVFLSAAILSSAYRVGFRDSEHRMRAIAMLAICGGGISIAVVNWIRLARPRPPVHFGWTLLVLAALIAVVAPG